MPLLLRACIASELFGHEQGAFTGATRRRPGRFELAHQGTIFLDEVGELPLEMQVMLLRVLQERVIERVGGEPLAVDVRVIAATHQDLTAAIHQGRFRADLFFRLNVFPIQVPPLRERREDIPDLVRHFLHRFSRRMGKPVAGISAAALRLLTEYPWPGNVRELENIVERAMIVTTGDTLEVEAHWLESAHITSGAPDAGFGLADLERRAILDALQRCHGQIYGPNGAAAALGLKPTTLYGKMRKHHIAAVQRCSDFLWSWRPPIVGRGACSLTDLLENAGVLCRYAVCERAQGSNFPVTRMERDSWLSSFANPVMTASTPTA